MLRLVLATAIEGGALRANPTDRFGITTSTVATSSGAGISRAPGASPLHDMRHTCTALLIDADPLAHPLAVMKRLGHSSITVTYNTYGHLFWALEEALTESLDCSYRAAHVAGGRP